MEQIIEQSPDRGALAPAVLAVAVATFTVVTTEMLPVGLLTTLGDGLGLSDGTAGLTVTLPGVVAALAAPVLPVAVRRADRRSVLCALLALLAGANLLAALAPAFGVLLAARALVGVCIGGVWAVAAGLGVRLVRAEDAGRATAVIFSGIAVASVLGVPTGTLMGTLAGWRWTFAAMAGLALAVAALLALLLPPLPPRGAVRPAEIAGLLRIPALRAGLLAVALLVTGHFAAYTYVRPALERVPAISPEAVSGLLLGYGVAGVAGNFLAGAVAAHTPRRALLTVSAVLAGTVLLTARAGGSLPATVTLLVVWGLAYGGVSVSAQNWLMATVPAHREAGSALFAGIFNAAIALGALAGGRAADRFEVAGALWLGGTLAALALGAGLAGLAGRPGAGREPGRGSRTY
ncbi:MFS transporter [Streptomyces corynorhini]|uniref:MFS transporter n=1 Tax=Streptomyces corynorhini TaxID=2282652 RepID=A0A370BDJ6_9ACTN|nr:MFS transporter [Streptomyces corynorhini]RDG39711.1 MFS transporter [Streptomyces corynorhini]